MIMMMMMMMMMSGGSRGGHASPSPILSKKKIAEGRKPGRASRATTEIPGELWRVNMISSCCEDIIT